MTKQEEQCGGKSCHPFLEKCGKGPGKRMPAPEKPRMLVLEQHMEAELSMRQSWECLLWESLLEHE